MAAKRKTTKRKAKTTRKTAGSSSKITKTRARTVKKEKGIRAKIIINAPKLSEEEALKKANEKLSKVVDKIKKKSGKGKSKSSDVDVEHISLDDLDGVDLATIKKLEKKGVRIIFPNLKYAKPKYENVSELIKFVESDQPQEGGVKIIIMNFND